MYYAIEQENGSKNSSLTNNVCFFCSGSVIAFRILVYNSSLGLGENLKTGLFWTNKIVF